MRMATANIDQNLAGRKKKEHDRLRAALSEAKSDYEKASGNLLAAERKLDKATDAYCRWWDAWNSLVSPKAKGGSRIMAQRCSYCGRTYAQHKGRPCVDAPGFKKLLEQRETLSRKLAGRKGVVDYSQAGSPMLDEDLGWEPKKAGVSPEVKNAGRNP